MYVYRDIFQSSFRFTGKLIGKYRVPIYTPHLPYSFKQRNGEYLKYLTGEWLKKQTNIWHIHWLEIPQSLWDVNSEPWTQVASR